MNSPKHLNEEKYLVQSAGSFPVLKLGEKYKDILNGNSFREDIKTKQSPPTKNIDI